ncbi:hypothetical protein FHT86_003274 [Rhizobium sp. BK313]|uniref:hypothetical protein n=1 Tax=Rhizobium sp. BK313 TaxID=2587081 RepID=UPI0010E73C26|nr:hypothetical protein [Rhizobium sp. BK313]MBB3454975.1 hypothetical protein [Rhizobium sp. BK313]
MRPLSNRVPINAGIGEEDAAPHMGRDHHLVLIRASGETRLGTRSSMVCDGGYTAQ